MSSPEMRYFIFFNEFICQFCKTSFLNTELFYLMDCCHPVCRNCIANYAWVNKCQISDCPGKQNQLKKEPVNYDDFDDKLRNTQKRLLDFELPDNHSQYCYVGSISPLSPVFIKNSEFRSGRDVNGRNVDNWMNMELLLSNFHPNFVKIRKVYDLFKKYLRKKNLMLFQELTLETFLKKRMRQMENLKIKDFFYDIPSFSLDDSQGTMFIFCRCLTKIRRLLETTMDKVFNLTIYNQAIHKVFEIIQETGFDLEKVEDNQQMLVSFNVEISEKNDVLSSKLPWPKPFFSNKTEDSIDPPVKSLDFHRMQDARLRKRIEFRTQPDEIWKRKKIRGMHRMDTSIKFRKLCQSTMKNISQACLLKNRMVKFLCFLFPSANKWTQLVHVQSDVNSQKKFKEKCYDNESTVVFMKSGQFIVGGFNDQKWKYNCDYSPNKNVFIFSINKSKKYPILFNGTPGCCFYSSTTLIGFGWPAISISPNFQTSKSSSQMRIFEVDEGTNEETELFGSPSFFIDEIEVFKVQ